MLVTLGNLFTTRAAGRRAAPEPTGPTGPATGYLPGDPELDMSAAAFAGLFIDEPAQLALSSARTFAGLFIDEPTQLALSSARTLALLVVSEPENE